MKVLVTGGAGYIGSHTCKALAREGFTPITYDNMIYGHEWAVKWGPFYQGDVLDTEKLTQVLKKNMIEAVLHFAGFAYVGESNDHPLKYYRNNVSGSTSLLEAMKSAGVQKFVFSSSCSTYGVPEVVPISEDSQQAPINPYGRSKWIVEGILSDCAVPYGLSSVALRYFNACGADVDLDIGEDHDPETHLIPLAIDAAIDQKKKLTVFGADYPTHDGTCIRDYVHVMDLATAHVAALGKLSSPGFQAYNIGTGRGTSVNEIISEVEKVTGRKVSVEFGKRRPGDAPILVASGEKARKELGWTPQYSSLNQIISTAISWKEQHFGRR